jgi:predicted DNA-binding transcriptional regulator YafY
MKNLNQLVRLEKAHQLIKLGVTGTPKEFSSKMNMSQRSLFRLLDQLKEIEAPICYDKKSFTYYYCSHFEFILNYKIEVLKDEELVKIFAGVLVNKFNSLPYCGSGGIYI